MPKNHKQKFTVVIEKDESGLLIGEVVGLPGCYSQGKTEKSLLKNIKEAIELHLEGIKTKRKKFVPETIFVKTSKVVIHA